MEKGRGKETKKLAKNLEKLLGESKWTVFSAHGGVNPQNKLRPKPMLQEYELSWVDIAIADEKEKKVNLLCEVEESSDNPKKIIGDIVNIQFSKEKIKIKRDKENIFRYDEIHLIVVLLCNHKERSKKLEEMIKNRIKPLNEDFSFELIFGENSKDVTRNLEERVLEILDL